MKRLRAYKTELKVNNKERTLLTRYAGASRFIYNWALADRKAMYEAGGKPNKFEQKRRFNALKYEKFPWLQEIAYAIIDSTFDNLDRAYQNFFRRVKSGVEKAGFPKFKSRKKGIGGFMLRGCIRLTNDTVQLPRIGNLRLAEHGYLPTDGIKILSANVSEHAGHWLISLQVEEEVADPIPATNPPLGIDVGIKLLAPYARTAQPSTIQGHSRSTNAS